MASTQQQQDVAQFQMITGLPEADCRQRLQSFKWSLDTALDAYFNSNVAPPTTMHTPAASSLPAPPAVPPVVQPVAPVIDDDFLCGLFPKKAAGGGGSVPLRGLSVKAQVVDMVAQVEVSQRYFNPNSFPIEAQFKWRQEECSIFGFEAVVDGETVVGQVKEKHDALDAFDDAISSGGRAFLLARDEEEQDKGAFKLSVGNLGPGKECVVTVRYVSELAMEGDSVRLSLPITRLPLLLPSSSSSGSDDGGKDENGGVRDGLEVVIDVEMSSSVSGIECPSGHHLHISHPPQHEARNHTAHIELRQQEGEGGASGTGVVVLVGQRRDGPAGQEARGVVEVDEASGTGVAMVSFVAQQLAARLGEEADVIGEVVFVVDRSGSMAGSRMNQAKNALSLFLHSLPMGTRFNVIGFGSGYQKLFPSSRAYDDETLATASEHARNLKADLGGTALLAPLRDLLSSPADPLFPRQVFVLTDGEVENTREVVELVRAQAKKGDTRVFTLGIGSDASASLVVGMAKAGRGQAEFVVSGERLEAKVLRQLKRALQPVLKQPSIHFPSGGETGAVKAQTPVPLGAVFEGDRVIGYALFDTTDTALMEKALRGAVLRASTDVEEGSEQIEFKIASAITIKRGQLIHRLAARSLIRDLEEAGEEAHKERITELALRYGLVSAFTSFVASVESDEAIEHSMERVQVNDALQSSAAARGAIAPQPSLSRPGAALPASPRNSASADPFDGMSGSDQLEAKADELREASRSYGGSSGRSSKKSGGGFLSSIGNAFSGLGSRVREGSGPASAKPAAAVADDKWGSDSSDEEAAAPSKHHTEKGKAKQLRERKREQEERGRELRAREHEERERAKHSEERDIKRERDVAEEKKKEEEEKEEEKEKRKQEESAGGKLSNATKNKDKEKKDKKRHAAKKEEKEFVVDRRARSASASTNAIDCCFIDPEFTSEEARVQDNDDAASGFSADFADFTYAPAQEQEQQKDAFAGFTFQPSPSPYSLSSSARASPPPAAAAGPAPVRAYGGAAPVSVLGRGAPPKPAPAPAASLAHMRPLDRFVHGQKANGSWTLDGQLAQALGRELSALAGAVPAGISAEVWATALALAALDSQFAAEKEEWELLAGKAKRWLARELAKVAVDKSVESLLADAVAFLAA